MLAFQHVPQGLSYSYGSTLLGFAISLCTAATFLTWNHPSLSFAFAHKYTLEEAFQSNLKYSIFWNTQGWEVICIPNTDGYCF